MPCGHSFGLVKMTRSMLGGRSEKWCLNITQQIGNLHMDEVPAFWTFRKPY